MYRRNIVLALLLLMVSLSVFSQRLITGRIIDINTKAAVGQVDVSVFKGTATTTTRENGYFQLKVNPGDSLLIMHPEYKLGLISIPAADVFSVYMEKVDDYPIYLDGQAKLYRYLKDNLHFSPTIRSKRHEGVLFIQLVINTNGKIEDCILLNSFTRKYEQNALEVFKNIPGSWSMPNSSKNIIFPLIYGFANSINRIEMPQVELPEAKIMEKIMVLSEDF